MTNIEWFADVGVDDVARVGGKNASLGELSRELLAAGVRVPNGFATTADAYRRTLEHNGLTGPLDALLAGWDRRDLGDLERRASQARSLVLGATLPPDLVADVSDAYAVLSREAGAQGAYCAVRSSATAEDLPEASFAGQQETFLMVHGTADVLDALRRCFASLFTARAISYREHLGVGQQVALSAGIQRMVRADLASSGVMFTLDTDSGHRDVVYLTAVWGLGENIVQGRVIPDAFFVHKPTLRAGFAPIVSRRRGAKELRLRYDEGTARLVNEPTPPADRARLCLNDDDVLALARWAVAIEDHYSARRGVPTPMDIEWAKDGLTGELFVVQARPETVHSQQAAGRLEVFELKGKGVTLAQGLAVGERIANGPVRRVEGPSAMQTVQVGDVIVTEVTDPDWEPVLKKAAALVTERGGRTSHAAIVARELSIPAVVGVGPLGPELANDRQVTVSCAQGETGVVLDGAVPFEVSTLDLASLPATRTEVMLNVGDPSQALKFGRLPSAGVGLARMEFIFASHVGVHPLALTRPGMLSDADRERVARATAGYDHPVEFLLDRLSQGIGLIGAAFWPRPVIVRFSDFKTNEYARLIGGAPFEPSEPNPMLGWRGASRYYHPDYKDGFALEVQALRRARNDFGLTNLKVMVPFCRTPEEGRAVIAEMAAAGLPQGDAGLEVYVMAEIPANVLQAAAFAEVFDGFSIGSNDLTQLVLGVDRDSLSVAHLFNERDQAVKTACSMVIRAAKAAGRRIGICGQAPSDYPDFAAFLVGEGIDSISVTPDALARTIETVARAERA